MRMGGLENWIVENNIIERTKRGFWTYIHNYKTDSPKEFEEDFKNIDFNFLETEISKIGLIINYEFDEPIQFVLAQLVLKHSGEKIGVYEFLFSLDGSDMDDYLFLGIGWGLI